MTRDASPSADMAVSADFFEKAGLNRSHAQNLVDDAVGTADDGELYLEYRQSETLGFDDGRLKAASFDEAQGFGLRAVSGEATGYAHAADLSEAAMQRAADAVRAVHSGHKGETALAPIGTNRSLYIDDNPINGIAFDAKVKLLQDIDAYARAKDPKVRQVSASIAASWGVVEIIRAGGLTLRDVRPLVRLNVSIIAGDGDRQESGSYGMGGRNLYDEIMQPETWQAATDEALRQALVNLESVPAPAGEMTVVLGPGWPGILLHEAVGHGL
ncbi:MAG: TldD/PmbA family protein, partial [Alphaproteobacteria bacterium]